MKRVLAQCYAYFLVALQFGTLGYLVFTGDVIARHPGLFLLQGLAAYVALAALWRMSGTQWNIVPHPHPRGRLITRGIYRRIRHPMYTSLYLIGLTWIASTYTPYRAVAFTVLCITLWLKIMREEQTLRRHYGSAYTDYQSRTHRLVPGVL